MKIEMFQTPSMFSYAAVASENDLNQLINIQDKEYSDGESDFFSQILDFFYDYSSSADNVSTTNFTTLKFKNFGPTFPNKFQRVATWVGGRRIKNQINTHFYDSNCTKEFSTVECTFKRVKNEITHVRASNLLLRYFD